MNKDNKLRTASLLMTLSILLLVLLQVYWLRNAWFDEYRRLKRELGVILRETVMKEEMKHFVNRRGNILIEALPVDSSGSNQNAFGNRDRRLPDSGYDKSNIRIIYSHDSVQHLLPGRNFRPERDRDNDGERLTVVFPLPNTQHLDTLRINYTRALSAAGFDLPFVFRRIAVDSAQGINWMGSTRIRDSAAIGQERSRFFSGAMVEAKFDNPYLVLLKKIGWQVIFAVVMLMVTTLSFIFLYRSLRQQKRLAELKNDFIANVTHELKTPIATVAVAIEALKNFDTNRDTERTKEYLDISSLELQRLNMLVDKVLKLSMLGQHQIKLNKEPIDLEQLIQEVLTSMKLQFEKQGAQLDFDASGTDFTIIGDRMHLQSVFYNLLDNALKYSPGQPRVGVAIKESGNKLNITISDNGIGIAPANQQKIFEKFFRVPHGNTHNIKGYGLGLSYVYDVVTSHGGTIKVDSREGAGSEFTVILDKNGNRG